MSLHQSPYIYVVSKNVIEEQVGFSRFCIIKTELLECCIQVAEGIDGKIDSVEMRCSLEVNLGIRASPSVPFILNQVAWILSKTFIGIEK